jgi:excisionase family DNA binding protein
VSNGSGGGGRGMPRLNQGKAKLCYTIPEAAELIGVSRNHGYELARRGELPIVKMGKLKFVPKAKLHKMFGFYEESEES